MIGFLIQSEFAIFEWDGVEKGPVEAYGGVEIGGVMIDSIFKEKRKKGEGARERDSN